MSTTESEMIAPVEAFKEQKPVQKMFEEKKHAEGPWKRHLYSQVWTNISHDISYSGRA